MKTGWTKTGRMKDDTHRIKTPGLLLEKTFVLGFYDEFLPVFDHRIFVAIRIEGIEWLGPKMEYSGRIFTIFWNLKQKNCIQNSTRWGTGLQVSYIPFKKPLAEKKLTPPETWALKVNISQKVPPFCGIHFKCINTTKKYVLGWCEKQCPGRGSACCHHCASF